MLIAIVGSTSCSDNTGILGEDKFVVEAFVFAGEPVSGVKIKKTVPLSYPDSIAEAILDAQVILTKAGVAYELTITEDNDYEYTGSDLTVETGDVFDIEVIYNGVKATGTTVVPTPTTGLDISENEIIIPEITLGGGQGQGGGPGQGGQGGQAALQEVLSNSIIAEWDNSSEDLYFMIVENLVDELDPIFPDRISNRLRRFRFISEPTIDNFLEFSLANLETYGEHVVKVYHINQEYAALYENLEQDSRDLNEPPSNIINGQGVFSAFNSQNLYFNVKRE